jgi:hypothetical protein
MKPASLKSASTERPIWRHILISNTISNCEKRSFFMENLTVFLQLDGIKAERIDAEGNLLRSKAPEITRGMASQLTLHLRDQGGVPLKELETFAAWEFYAGNDWNPATPVQLAVVSGIAARNDTVAVPLHDTNTAPLSEMMGTAEKITLHAELLGFEAGQSAPSLVVQFEIAVRNRVALSGTEAPGELPQIYLTAGAVKALVAEETLLNAPRISAAGTWEIGGADTGLPSTGAKGDKGEKGDKGDTGDTGEQGPKGDPMKIDATGTTDELSQYDSEPKGFSFLATDSGMVYIKNSDTSGDWSDPVGFQGPAGKDGVTPERGVDYWTESDIAEIKSYVDEAIINGEW